MSEWILSPINNILFHLQNCSLYSIRTNFWKKCILYYTYIQRSGFYILFGNKTNHFILFSIIVINNDT